MYPRVSLCSCVSTCIPVYHYVSPCIPVYHCVSPCIPVFLCIPVYHYVSPCITVFLCIPVHLLLYQVLTCVNISTCILFLLEGSVLGCQKFKTLSRTECQISDRWDRHWRGSQENGGFEKFQKESELPRESYFVFWCGRFHISGFVLDGTKWWEHRHDCTTHYSTAPYYTIHVQYHNRGVTNLSQIIQMIFSLRIFLKTTITHLPSPYE